MSERIYYKVGRRPWEIKRKPDGVLERRRGRVPFTNRHWRKWRDIHNDKTLQRQRVLVDKKPLWWLIGLGLLALITPFQSNSMISVASVICIHASINVLWTLIVGTAGIFSPATLAVVGVSGYAAAATNVSLGVPWPIIFLVGLAVGLVVGASLAAPSTRLDGLYYALLTMGVAEICRFFVSQLQALTPTGVAITQVDSFIPADWFFAASRPASGLCWRVSIAIGRIAGQASGPFRTPWLVAARRKHQPRRQGVFCSGRHRFPPRLW